ncbi:hypothetical protein RZR97_04510 [Hydrogenimonas thermophila]|uniref:hypothetical protein n=1 Tax=Hydrogenimonas thermophila TaxID=223786 RepID=UPI00293706BB|nr:hypothetical protein [Hydrogenimonas thermophila]WOE70837.1 hypothetical protein RZR91_04530 [Hydrogenimonas thermophila]WOE73355.1 hypothetical protein RZR97_04510 [Hydrogenimonas thermophila]
MHRTQIYFDETLFEELKKQANLMGMSLSAYIRETLKNDLKNKKSKQNRVNLKEFSGMWENRDISQESLRKKAWK